MRRARAIWRSPMARGPGLSNAMVSLHSAYHDATPLVMLVGQVERGDFGRLALQEQNYSRLLSDVTKQVIEVNEPEQASEAMARAFHLAESGTPGPVAVILPEDIFDDETDAELNQPGWFNSASVSSSKMSSGRITATGPGVPLSARWKARAIASEACSGSLTSMTCLVTSESSRE